MTRQLPRFANIREPIYVEPQRVSFWIVAAVVIALAGWGGMAVTAMQTQAVADRIATQIGGE